MDDIFVIFSGQSKDITKKKKKEATHLLLLRELKFCLRILQRSVQLQRNLSKNKPRNQAVNNNIEEIEESIESELGTKIWW